MATAIIEMLDRVRDEPGLVSSTARSEAERLFAPDVVCEQISQALARLVDGGEAEEPANAVAHGGAST
jgi:hypothetical protein